MTPNRRSKTAIKTIGIFGLGEAPSKSINAVLEDLSGTGEMVFVIPVTKTHFTESVEVVTDYLAEVGIRYEAVVDETTDKSRTLRRIAKDASATHKGGEVGIALVNVLKDASDARLFVFWDENLDEKEDGGAYDAAEYADEADIPCFDMCNGLEPLFDKTDTNEETGGNVGDDDDEDEPVVSKRATKDTAEDAAAREGLPPYEESRRKGIRELRGMARERKLAADRKIGGMSRDEVLTLLYPDGEATAAAPVSPAPVAPAPVEEETAVQTTLEEQIAAATHEVTASNGHVALPMSLTPDAATALGQFIYVLADAIATDVAARVKKELQDA